MNDDGLHVSAFLNTLHIPVVIISNPLNQLGTNSIKLQMSVGACTAHVEQRIKVCKSD